jgi:hypothetical protein
MEPMDPMKPMEKRPVKKEVEVELAIKREQERKANAKPPLTDSHSDAPELKVIAGGVGGLAFTLATGLLFKFTGVEISKDSVMLVVLAYGTLHTAFSQTVAYFKRNRKPKGA